MAAIIPESDGMSVPNGVIKPSQTANNGQFITLSGAEDEAHDNSGGDTAYNDVAVVNVSDANRLPGANDEQTSNGIANIAYIDVPEKAEYTVKVPADGNYSATIHVRTPAISSRDSKVVLTVDGTPGDTVHVPNTGNDPPYQNVSATLSLSAGTHVIRLTYFTGHLATDWFEVIRGVTTTAPTTVLTLVSQTVPPTVPTTVPAQARPPPSSAELQSTLDSANAAGTARLATMRAAYGAWAIPSRPDLVAIATDARTAGLKGDGVTDNTAALQALLNSQSAGATIYFPAGTYRIDGPVSITKPVTLVGEAGTVFNCQKAKAYVFNVNKGGSLSSKMNGVTVTGIVFEGPGVETSPAIFGCWYLQNVHFSYVKFHNVGFAAIRMQGCVDVVVEDSVFDNVFQEDYGYGVVLYDYCDNVIVRDNFFVTKGRHGIATGSATNENVGQYIKRVTVENNYFENFTDHAIDAHLETTGPYVVRGNVIVDSRVGINLRNGIADISNNVIINCPTGIVLRNQGVSASSIGSKVDQGRRQYDYRCGGRRVPG